MSTSAPDILGALDALGELFNAARLHKSHDGPNGTEKLRVLIQDLETAVRKAPVNGSAYFRKIRITPPDSVRSEWDKLKEALEGAGYRVG